ncbi:alpha/beta hydrolase [Arsenicibacter rosenii]|uniref:Esterase n=1 Tax=Arsenicibacter rosenii TaxID=1750698 RepID=A0A1S2VFR1_9BACT|nr:alpha/beta hydrolase [Arsenicibacter rosenii]OIN57552.1 esterase [Arsenicibacter rosenii]
MTLVKTCLSILAVLSGIELAVAQKPVNGLTGVRDTSFTNYSALKNAQKKHPDIRLVTPFTLPDVREKRNLTYAQYGDRAMQLDVFAPAKPKKGGYPAVLVIHGGGWRSGDRSQHIPLAQQLAAHGYVAVTVEYRLSTEALYPAAVYDLKAAIRWMRANAKGEQIDPKRIAVLGFSAGGQLATLVGTTNGDPAFEGNGPNPSVSSAVQAIVDIDGTLAFIHPESGEGDDSRSVSAATYWFGVNKETRPELWHEAGALNHVDSQTPPVLFINSSVDRMHAGRDDMRRKLDALGIYSEVKSFPDAPHTFCLFHPWFEPTVEAIVAFLKKQL